MADPSSERAAIADLRLIIKAWKVHQAPQRLQVPRTGIPRVDQTAAALGTLRTLVRGRRRILPYLSPIRAALIKQGQAQTVTISRLRSRLAEFSERDRGPVFRIK